MQNHLLAALPVPQYERVLPYLELVSLPLGWVVYEPGGPQSHLYFPTTSIVCLMYMMEDGATSEIAVIGNEGLVGMSLFMGGESMSSTAVVETAGDAYRIKASVWQKEFALGGPLQHLSLRFGQALMTQVSQTAVCNRFHSMHQQLCRWLLLSFDRVQGVELTTTQELIASMLGVRREGVTKIAGQLNADKAVEFRRGHVKLLDRSKMERCACECYQVVKQEYDRLLAPHTNPHRTNGGLIPRIPHMPSHSPVLSGNTRDA